jgi:hypothetical protein
MTDWLQSWLDNLCEVMAVTDRHGRQVRSYHVFDRNELPNSITSEDVPCAVSYVTDIQPQYSMGGPTLLFYQGQTEFHLTTDVKPVNVAYCMSIFEPIIRAAAGNMRLGATVESFTILQEQAGALQFSTYRNAEGRDDHQGVVVKWTVKQNISGDLVVSI